MFALIAVLLTIEGSACRVTIAPSKSGPTTPTCFTLDDIITLTIPLLRGRKTIDTEANYG